MLSAETKHQIAGCPKQDTVIPNNMPVECIVLRLRVATYDMKGEKNSAKS